MIAVMIESPYSEKNGLSLAFNIRYAQRAMRHSILKLELPMASHLLYTQILNDNNPLERQTGLNFCYELAQRFDKAAFYLDNGMSAGMLQAWNFYAAIGLPCERRFLYQ